MTQQELDAIKALADAATPGPWEHSRGYNSSYVQFYSETEKRLLLVANVAETSWLNSNDQANAAFIAAARAAVPALLAEVERLRDELDECRSVYGYKHPLNVPGGDEYGYKHS